MHVNQWILIATAVRPPGRTCVNSRLKYMYTSLQMESTHFPVRDLLCKRGRIVHIHQPSTENRYAFHTQCPNLRPTYRMWRKKPFCKRSLTVSDCHWSFHFEYGDPEFICKTAQDTIVIRFVRIVSFVRSIFSLMRSTLLPGRVRTMYFTSIILS